MNLRKRVNYQTNDYDLGNGKFAQTSSLGFVNYKNGSEFKAIDMSLIDHGTYWKTIKSVYYPTIPKYADEWCEFNNVYKGNNHSIKVKPVAEHVEGTLIKNNVILYPNAFGDSIDLEVTAYNGHLLKKIVIKNPQTEALYFDFEIEIDKKLDYRSIDNEKTKTEIVLDTSLKEISIEFEEGKTPTTIYPMKVWDSNGLIEYIDYKLFEQNEKTYFRKKISKEFLEKAVYPIFTDDDTGAQNPGTMADDAAVGTLTWSNPDNAKTSNNSWAIASTGGTAQTHYLKATNFGFSFTGTINGIIAKIEKQMANGGQPDTTVDNAVKIVKSDGSIGAENKAVGPNWNQNADATVTYGDSTDLWSESWSDTDITDVDFGFVVTADLTRVVGPGPNAYVDHMTMTVYYSGASVSETVTPSAETLTLTLQTPIVVIPITIEPSAETLTLTQQTPNINFDYNFDVSTQALSLTLQTPIIDSSTILEPTALDLTLTLLAPTTTISSSVSPEALDLTLALQTPTIVSGTILTPSALSLVLTLQTPPLVIVSNISPSTLALTTTFQTPTVSGTANVSPSALALTLASPTPTVSGTALVTPVAQALTLTQQAPDIISSSTITPSVLALTLSLKTPTFAISSIIKPSAQALSLSILTSTIDATFSYVEMVAILKGTTATGITKNTSISSALKQTSATARTKGATMTAITKNTDFTARTK